MLSIFGVSIVLYFIKILSGSRNTLYCSYIFLFRFKLIFYAYFAYHTFRGYENPPKPSDEKLQEAGHHFAAGILSALKSSSVSPFYVNMKLDVWRFLTYQKGTASEHRRHVLYSKNDFGRFKALPDYW